MGKSNNSSKGSGKSDNPVSPVKQSTASSLNNDNNSFFKWTKSEEKLNDIYLILFLTAAGILTRTWRIGHPSEVVFDEVHFGKFASYYLRREYYFDVHPPLGKLLFALVGYVVGYDGHFLFHSIGDSYIKHNVPYIALRMVPATLGALIVPLSYLILRNSGVSVAASLFGGICILLDNALIAQTRLILLDSMLTFFCIFTIFSWTKFANVRHEPFSKWWWTWLSLTGVGLGCTCGIKMVGFLTVATIGVAVIYELWGLLDIHRGLPMRVFIRHFSARSLCLIFLPFFLYLSFFYVHFAILVNSGPGDGFMSPAFQEGLIGSDLNTNSSAIPYYSDVVFKHKELSVYLHSHLDKYPLRYDDGRISSAGQQVTGYSHLDANDYWVVEPIDPKYTSLTLSPLTSEEKERQVRYVRAGDIVRIRHKQTNGYLITHDVASSLMPTHMEVTLHYTNDTSVRYDETLWIIKAEKGVNAGDKLVSKKVPIKIINNKHQVAIHCHKGVLPEWGFGQNEVNGNKNLVEKNNVWSVYDVVHPRIVNGVEIGDTNAKVKRMYPKLSFMDKFVELQSLMIAHNAGLTKPHPYSSSPITWPFVTRGISFWEKEDGLKQIYLLGNPLIWWTAFASVIFYLAIFIVDRTFLQRGIDDVGGLVRRWMFRSPGFFFVAWLLHYLPFFTQGRMLFLHHYLPAFIFSVLLLSSLIDLLGRVFREPLGKSLSKKLDTPLKAWNISTGSRNYIIFLVIVIAIFAKSFMYFSPLTYGLGFPSVEILRQHKWFKGWDLQYA